jgi:hypothetical protein
VRALQWVGEQPCEGRHVESGWVCGYLKVRVCGSKTSAAERLPAAVAATTAAEAAHEAWYARVVLLDIE